MIIEPIPDNHTNVFFLLYTTTCVYSDVHVQGVNCKNTFQLSKGGGAGVFLK